MLVCFLASCVLAHIVHMVFDICIKPETHSGAKNPEPTVVLDVTLRPHIMTGSFITYISGPGGGGDPTCQTLSPLRMPCLLSAYPKEYLHTQ